MANTQRTIADLLSKLPDNTAQLIGPQDVRDIVETLRNGHAQLFIDPGDEAETAISIISTPVKVAGVTTLTTAPVSSDWSMPQSNRLLYSGTAARLVKVDVALSMLAVGSNVNINFYLAKNGATVIDTEITRKIVVPSENGAAALTGLLEADPGDYFELWVENDTDTTNLTVTKLVMNVTDFAL